METIIRIRCFDTCLYQLVYPTFFVRVTKATLKTIFKYLFQFGWYEENQQAIAFLDRELPEIVQTVDAWNTEKIKNTKAALFNQTIKQAEKDRKRAGLVYQLYLTEKELRTPKI